LSTVKINELKTEISILSAERDKLKLNLEDKNRQKEDLLEKIDE
jgi:outer membrane murein-binding lipoprotein Lpp